MRIKGIVKLEFVDVKTGEVTKVEENENFIHQDRLFNIFNNGWNFRQIIIYRGKDIFPVEVEKSRYLPVDYDYYVFGYNPSGTSFSTYYPETSESPAYYEFYKQFSPPSSTSIIREVALTNESGTSSSSRWYAYKEKLTSMNLNPPCYQEPTEYLNVYYRLIFIKDETDGTNNFIKERMIEDLWRNYYSKRIYPQGRLTLYPLRINESTNVGGKFNYFPGETHYRVYNSLFSPTDLNLPLHAAWKCYEQPPGYPNEYTQITNTFTKTVLRGGGSRLDYNFEIVKTYNSYGIERNILTIHPENFAPDIGTEGFSGIGNVFSSSGSSTSRYFDAAYFPLGSGKLHASGLWDATKTLPRFFEVLPQNDAQTHSNGEYRVEEYFGGSGGEQDFNLILLPVFKYDSSSSVDYTTEVLTNLKNRMYQEPDRIHFYKGQMRLFIEEHSFITWDSTGLTLYDVKNGKLHSFDQQSVPALNATNIVDVKVDSNKNIWVACSNTGLYKITIDPEVTTVAITEIGVLPGSQKKCYALEVDDHGNVFAVFWGGGLYYTTDSGDSWNNVILNYAPFTDYDEGGTNSKWRFCKRIVLNRHRDVKNGDAQLLLLLDENSPDYSISGGCWYDQISANVTGITDSSLKSQLKPQQYDQVYYRGRHSFDVTRTMTNYGLEERWFFINGNSQIYYVTFQQNSGATRVYNSYSNHIPYCFDIDIYWDYETGTFREYITTSNPYDHDNDWDDFAIAMDCQTLAIKATDRANSDNFDVSTLSVDSNAIKFTHNTWIQYIEGTEYGKSFFYKIGFSFRALPQYKQFAAKHWGWDGSQWVENHLGNRPIHTTTEDFLYGIKLRFEDGPVGTQSWRQGDRYYFTCFDGYYKDNVSKFEFKDTVYWKPIEKVTAFTPSTVQLIDNTSERGLLSGADINEKWNIDQLPDSTYSGGAIITDGDQLYAFVTYLSYFADPQITDERFGEVPNIAGTLSTEVSEPLFGQATTYFNEESGLWYNSSSRYSFGTSDFTLEGWFKFEEVGYRERVLFDFREGSDTENGYFYLNKDGRLEYNLSGSIYGNLGQTLQPDQWYYIALVRSGNDWTCYVDGISQWTFTNSTGFSSSRPFHIGKRYSKTSIWHKNAVTVTYGVDDSPVGPGTANRFVPTTQYDNHFFRLKDNVSITGDHTFSVFLKAESSDVAILSLAASSSSSYCAAVFDLTNGVVYKTTQTGSVQLLGTDIQSVGDGWYRCSISGNDFVKFYVTSAPTKDTAIGSWGLVTYTPSASESFLVAGAMLETGTTMTPYTTGVNNLITEQTTNFEGTYNSFRGWCGGVRATKFKARYLGNFNTPTEPWKNTGNVYDGARIKLTGAFNSGAIVSKTELIGDWTVVFKGIDSYDIQRERPIIAFGVTSYKNVTTVTDIGYRVLPGENVNGVSFESWMDSWGDADIDVSINSTSTNAVELDASKFDRWYKYDLYLTEPVELKINQKLKLNSSYVRIHEKISDTHYKVSSSSSSSRNITSVFWVKDPDAIRFRKIGNRIYVDYSTDSGLSWTTYSSWVDTSPVHYVAFYQFQPYDGGDYLLPAVEIENNGSAYFSKVGDPFLATGHFNPKFEGFDCFWDNDVKLYFNDDALPVNNVDPNWDSVASLLHFEGLNRSDIFIDETGKNWTSNGVQLSESQKKFGRTSGFFNGSLWIESETSLDWAFGTNDFTIEFFVNPSAFTIEGYDAMLGNWDGTAGWAVRLDPTGVLIFNANGSEYATAPNTLAEDVWQHIAIARESGILRMFVDGVKVYEGPCSEDLQATRALRIGNDYLNEMFYGYIDELRITTGVARYNTDFSVPTEPFSNTSVPGSVTSEGSDFLPGPVPPTMIRTFYRNWNGGVPLQGEVYCHPHGYIVFNPADVGKTITGEVICILD